MAERDPQLERLLPDLPPPPGGLARLRARLDAEEAQRARRWWWWAGLAAPLSAATAAALVWLPHRPPLEPTSLGASPAQLALTASPALARLGLVAPADDVARVTPGAGGEVAVIAVPVATPGVSYYRVGVLVPAE